MRITLVQDQRWPRDVSGPVVMAAVWLSLVAGALGVAAWTGRALDLCLWKRITGIPCLTCGSGHGILALLQGHVGRAIAFNPLFFAVTATVLALTLLRLASGRQVVLHMTARERGVAWLCLAVAVVVQWTSLVLRAA